MIVIHASLLILTMLESYIENLPAESRDQIEYIKQATREDPTLLLRGNPAVCSLVVGAIEVIHTLSTPGVATVDNIEEDRG